MSQMIVLIPARGGSRGIPKKNLVSMCGKPLLAWSIEQALAADIGPVIVATDDPEIGRVANGYGTIVYDEPPDVAGDTVAMETVMEWVLGELESGAEGSGPTVTTSKPEWLMVCQPTSPLRLASHVREAWAVCQTNAFDSVFSVVPSAHCSWRYRGEQIQIDWPQDPQGKPRQRMLRQQAGRQVTENGAIYAVRTYRFLEEETRFCGRVYAYEMPDWTRFEVDTPEDLAIVELIMRTRLRLGADGVRT